jgi:hypothetical protein
MLGCGRNITARQAEEPCTRTSQCDVGLECLTGVCQVQPDGGSDVDAGSDAGP